MSANLKRKGSPALSDVEEPAKRRFAETAEIEESSTQAPQSPSDTNEPANAEPTPTSTTADITDPTSRAARFAALRARNAASRKSNLTETKSEARRAATDTTALSALARKRDIATHKLLRAEHGEEAFERKRAWDWTVEESEKWDARQEEKEAARRRNKFDDYAAEASKVYERQMANLERGEGLDVRKGEYEEEKRRAIERAVAGGGLEIVELGDGELIAVDRDGTWIGTGEGDGGVAGAMKHRPGKEVVERLVADIRKAEEVRLKKRRDRGRADAVDDGSDVTYINSKNKQFNQKLARFYNKYTAEIRESFERGTAM